MARKCRHSPNSPRPRPSGPTISSLNVFLDDNRQAWDLQADGRWLQRRADGGEERASHRRLLGDSWGLPKGASAADEPVVPALV